MPFMVSPGVRVREIDLTNVIPAISTSIGAIAGHFTWGPVQEIVTVGSEKELIDRFGYPDNNTFQYMMPASQYLQYSNTLRVVRTATDGQMNSNSGGSGKLILNKEDFETATFVSGDEWIAKYPGTLGNSIGIAVATSKDAFESSEFTQTGFAAWFNFAPGTSEFAESKGVENDELHVVIFDVDGSISGTIGSVLETFSGLSQLRDAKKNDGTNNYYVDVINKSSRYVWVGLADSTLPDSGMSSKEVRNAAGTDQPSVTTNSDALVYLLTGGIDGASNKPTLGELKLAYDMFRDADFIDVNFIIGIEAGQDDISLANYLIELAQERRDSVAFVSPSISRTVNTINATTNVKIWSDQITSSSYGVLDSTALYVYDKYNDVFRWTVAAGSIAGLCANTDYVADPWFSPAGFTRGQLRGVLRIAFNPTQNQRDTLYKARVNPITSFTGEGIVLYGDKTAQTRPSAFDRINVRRLFIVLQKAISTAAKYQLFELNDEFTRAQFRAMVEPFLREVKGRRGITDFKVVCDETNNTPEVIDTNRFIADIYIKPSRSINFITLNFVAVRTGVEFSEIVGTF